MPKIQGKQLAYNTITQAHLNLTKPVSGDTSSGATVQYVNEQLSAVTSVSGIIGTPDDGTYTDGLFTSWTSNTTVANMADDVNEVLLLLAPSPPITNWDNVFSNLAIGGTTYSSMKIAGSSTTITSPITTDDTPSFSVSVIDLTAENARSRNGGTFTLSDSVHGTIETLTLTTSTGSKTTGEIRFTIEDPYDGVAGKSGFWTGVTAFSLVGSTSAFTPSATLRTLTFVHPGSDSPETDTFYVDSPPSTVTVTANSETMPSMSSYVSGVPTLAAGQTISSIDFDIAGAVKYFYNPTIWRINSSYVDDTGWSAPVGGTPAANSTYNETSGSADISDNAYNDTGFEYTIYGRNIQGTSDTDLVSFTTYRIDTVSDESTRKLSGTGQFPSTAGVNFYYGTWVSSSDLTTGDWVRELMMKNGKYQWPGSINYATNFGGPDYSSVTGGDTGASNYRWACFNVGTVSNETNFTFTLNGTENFGSSTLITGIYLYVKVVGATGTVWVDANAAWSGGNPTTDGDAMLVYGESTTTTKKVTFGTTPRTGTVYVRIGLAPSSTKKFTGIS